MWWTPLRAALAVAVAVGGLGFAEAACTPPTSLRSKLRGQPSAETLLQLGSWFDGRQQPACAVEAYRAALKTAPGTLLPHLKLAAALEEQKRTDEARTEWAAALKIDPRSTAALDGLAKHFITERNYGAAI